MNTKRYLNIFGPLLGIIVLSLFTVRFGLDKVTEVRNKVTVEKKNVNILTQKLESLNQATEVATQSQIVTNALPVQSPALSAISQIKILAINSGLSILNIKASGEGEDTKGLSKVAINFDVEGGKSGVFDLLSKISGFAPISKVEKVKLNEFGGVVRATVTVNSYFAKPPTKLPALTEAIKDLTADEKKVITDVSTLSQPLFGQITPSEGGGNEDPFGI